MPSIQSPTIGWPAITTLILLIITITAIILYVRWRSRKGFNDATDDEQDEDNSIIEWYKKYNQQFLNNHMKKRKDD